MKKNKRILVFVLAFSLILSNAMGVIENSVYAQNSEEKNVAETKTKWSKEDFNYRGDTVYGLNDKGKEKIKKLKNLVIPNGFKNIETNAFKDLEIESISLPNSLKKIEWYSFRNNKIKSLKLPDNLKSIGYYSFAYNKLESATCGKNLEVIGDSAFVGNKIKTIKFNEGLKRIETQAFFANDIENLSLPKSLERIEKWAFIGNKIRKIPNINYVKNLEKEAIGVQEILITPKENKFRLDLIKENNEKLDLSSIESRLIKNEDGTYSFKDLQKNDFSRMFYFKYGTWSVTINPKDIKWEYNVKVNYLEKGKVIKTENIKVKSNNKPNLKDTIEVGGKTYRVNKNNLENINKNTQINVNVKEFTKIGVIEDIIPKDKLEVKKEFVKIGQKIDLTDNITNLPKGAKIEVLEDVDTNKKGKHIAKVKVIYPNKTSRIVDIPVEVSDKVMVTIIYIDDKGNKINESSVKVDYNKPLKQKDLPNVKDYDIQKYKEVTPTKDNEEIKVMVKLKSKDASTQTNLTKKDIDDLEKSLKQKVEKEKNTCNNKDKSFLEKQIKNLKDKLNTKNKEIERLKVEILNLPEGIEVGQWYPEKIVKLPNKLSYYDNENLDLEGMVMLFTKFIKKDNGYEKINVNVSYNEFSNIFKGWKFNLITKKALLKNTIKGKMKVEISFVLEDKKESMK